MAEYLPRYAPGKAQTRTSSAAITAGNLLVISGSGTVAPTSAGTLAWCGVAGNDCSGTGLPVTVYSGGVQRLVASGTVTAGQTVEPAASGAVATHTPGTNDLFVVGVALTTATTGLIVEIQMER